MDEKKVKKRILVWAERNDWLSHESYPEVHRRFAVTHFDTEAPPTGPASLLLVDDTILRSHTEEVRQIAQNSTPFSLPVIAVGDSHADQGCEDYVYDVISPTPSEWELLRTVRNASDYLDSERRLRESQAAAEKRARELEKLSEIGVALSAERDHKKLLSLILSKSREITTADAGSLFLVESIDEPIGREDRKGDQARVQARWLRLRLAQNDSRPFELEEQVLPITSGSIAGYVALSGAPLNIVDAYRLPQETPYTIHRSFDESTGYRSQSMLVVPMKNRDGEPVGVLQLINKKADASTRLSSPENFAGNVMPFTSNDEQLVYSLASQAAISVENNALYQRIETIFYDFVEASVMAIEKRDPVTRGHSRRVARMTVELARVTGRVKTGTYRDLSLSDEELRELKYAALLHDFGKIGVKEKVLLKAKKLLSGELALVWERFQTARRAAEVEYLRLMLERLMKKEETRSLEMELRRKLADINRAWEEVQAANQPTVTDSFIDTRRLDELGCLSIPNADGSRRPLLEQEELLSLKITRGTLTGDERKEVNDHVVHTYEFLSKIRWTRDLRNIPKLARGHHEKLDGKGYPLGLAAPEIAPQTRMMTISDIFDALAAQDRPYKPKVPTAQALDILRAEAQKGWLDEELVDLFIEAKVFRLVE